jgi:hypothetical protein
MAALQGKVSIPMIPLPTNKSCLTSGNFSRPASLTVCRLEVPTNRWLRVLGYGFLDDQPNTAQPVQVQIGRISGDGATPSALTILPNDEVSGTDVEPVAPSKEAEPPHPTPSIHEAELAPGPLGCRRIWRGDRRGHGGRPAQERGGYRGSWE